MVNIRIQNPGVILPLQKACHSHHNRHKVQRHKGTEFFQMETLNQFNVFLIFAQFAQFNNFLKSTQQYQILCAYVPLCLGY